jgi:translation initiation factor IF-1
MESRVYGPTILRSGSCRYAYPIVFAALLVLAAGCYRASHETGPEEGMSPSATSAPLEKEKPGTEVSQAAGTVSPPLPPENHASYEKPPPQDTEEFSPETVPVESPAEIPPDSSPLPARREPPPTEQTPALPKAEGKKAVQVGGEPEGETPAATPPQAVPAAPASPSDAEQGAVIAMLPQDQVFSGEGPLWTREKEELSYKVEFLGITMGYARFSFLGKVLLSGREAYHLRVRAWTSDLLSLIYPIDDTIDYYLDVGTMLPLRQEYARSRKEDDVATYDQEKGTIVYRFKKDGTIRKTVTVVPKVYDPVSLVYYFRTRAPEKGEKEQTMYAGRKLWEVSAKVMGSEQIRTGLGEFDTLIIEPELRREGKIEKGKDMRMWMTRDEHHVPVRVYAKFKKIRTWTLVGDLLPDREGG